MRIYVRLYRRKDGSPMVYLNNDRGVSLGLTPEKGYQSSKATIGQQNLYRAFWRAIKTQQPVAIGVDLSGHKEVRLEIGELNFVGTDVSKIGDTSVPADGLYIVHEGNVFYNNFVVDC